MPHVRPICQERTAHACGRDPVAVGRSVVGPGGVGRSSGQLRGRHAVVHVAQVQEAFQIPPARLETVGHHIVIAVLVERLLVVGDAGVLAPDAGLVDADVVDAHGRAGEPHDIGVHLQPVQPVRGVREQDVAQELLRAERRPFGVGLGELVALVVAASDEAFSKRRVTRVKLFGPRVQAPELFDSVVDVGGRHKPVHEHPAVFAPVLRRLVEIGNADARAHRLSRRLVRRRP